jgi:hypothetical protein
METGLSTEQQFELAKLVRSAENLTREQAIDLLIQVTELAMRRQTVIQSLIKKKGFYG